MRIDKYHDESHRDLFETLLKSRKLSLNLALDLPTHGYIAFEKDIPVAAGFLRFIEGSFAILDSYITNSEMSGDMRHVALIKITEKLIELSKRFQLQKLFAFSLESSLLDRICGQGFKRVPYEFTALNLREP